MSSKVKEIDESRNIRDKLKEIGKPIDKNLVSMSRKPKIQNPREHSLCLSLRRKELSGN